jgi:hypothetical protein
MSIMTIYEKARNFFTQYHAAFNISLPTSYESKIAPYAGIPLDSISYTTFVVNLLLLITQTASAPLSLYNPYARRLISGFPLVLVFQISACGSVFLTLSTISFPKVSSGFGAVHKMRHGTFCARITARQGPMPDPVATRTMERKRVAMRRTPQVGMPRM